MENDPLAGVASVSWHPDHGHGQVRIFSEDVLAVPNSGVSEHVFHVSFSRFTSVG